MGDLRLLMPNLQYAKLLIYMACTRMEYDGQVFASMKLVGIHNCNRWDTVPFKLSWSYPQNRSNRFSSEEKVPWSSWPMSLILSFAFSACVFSKVKGGTAITEQLTKTTEGYAVAVGQMKVIISIDANKPVCDTTAPTPPVSGYVSQGNLNLDAGCRYNLYEASHATDCLQGSWIMMTGSSNTLLELLGLGIPDFWRSLWSRVVKRAIGCNRQDFCANSSEQCQVQLIFGQNFIPETAPAELQLWGLAIWSTFWLRTNTPSTAMGRWLVHLQWQMWSSRMEKSPTGRPWVSWF